MKGIILAAGRGTRLYPMTKPVCKPLLPVYDKPLIYYPLTVLLQAGIRDIMIIVPPGEEGSFQALLGDGTKIGVHIEYAVQPKPRGIADAFLVGEEFIDNDRICLVLGDNILYSRDLPGRLKKVEKMNEGAVIFGCRMEDPRPFGVVEFDEDGKVISIEEKPKVPKSDYIVPGIYFYDNRAVEIARGLKPSARGELEITDVNLEYLRRGQLQVIPFEEGMYWFDAGTADNLLMASEEIRKIQKNGAMVGCIEEAALNAGFISASQAHMLGNELAMTEYGQWLIGL